MVRHPDLPVYALWCTIKQASWYHFEKLPADWTGGKVTARQELGGYQSVADMMEASVGVRLILLWEGLEATNSVGVPTVIEAQLKTALNQFDTATSRQAKDALIYTLSHGIDYCTYIYS
jgi:hypothetical protein